MSLVTTYTSPVCSRTLKEIYDILTKQDVPVYNQTPCPMCSNPINKHKNNSSLSLSDMPTVDTTTSKKKKKDSKSTHSLISNKDKVQKSSKTHTKSRSRRRSPPLDEGYDVNDVNTQHDIDDDEDEEGDITPPNEKNNDNKNRITQDDLDFIEDDDDDNSPAGSTSKKIEKYLTDRSSRKKSKRLRSIEGLMEDDTSSSSILTSSHIPMHTHSVDKDNDNNNDNKKNKIKRKNNNDSDDDLVNRREEDIGTTYTLIPILDNLVNNNNYSIQQFGKKYYYRVPMVSSQHIKDTTLSFNEAVAYMHPSDKKITSITFPSDKKITSRSEHKEKQSSLQRSEYKEKQVPPRYKKKRVLSPARKVGKTRLPAINRPKFCYFDKHTRTLSTLPPLDYDTNPQYYEKLASQAVRDPISAMLSHTINVKQSKHEKVQIYKTLRTQYQRTKALLEKCSESIQKYYVNDNPLRPVNTVQFQDMSNVYANMLSLQQAIHVIVRQAWKLQGDIGTPEVLDDEVLSSGPSSSVSIPASAKSSTETNNCIVVPTPIDPAIYVPNVDTTQAQTEADALDTGDLSKYRSISQYKDLSNIDPSHVNLIKTKVLLVKLVYDVNSKSSYLPFSTLVGFCPYYNQDQYRIDTTSFRSYVITFKTARYSKPMVRILCSLCTLPFDIHRSAKCCNAFTVSQYDKERCGGCGCKKRSHNLRAIKDPSIPTLPPLSLSPSPATLRNNKTLAKPSTSSSSSSSISSSSSSSSSSSVSLDSKKDDIGTDSEQEESDEDDNVEHEEESNNDSENSNDFSSPSDNDDNKQTSVSTGRVSPLVPTADQSGRSPSSDDESSSDDSDENFSPEDESESDNENRKDDDDNSHVDPSSVVCTTTFDEIVYYRHTHCPFCGGPASAHKSRDASSSSSSSPSSSSTLSSSLKTFSLSDIPLFRDKNHSINMDPAQFMENFQRFMNLYDVHESKYPKLLAHAVRDDLLIVEYVENLAVSSTWSSLKQQFIDKYTDRQTRDSYVSQLDNCFQTDGERCNVYTAKFLRLAKRAGYRSDNRVVVEAMERGFHRSIRQQLQKMVDNQEQFQSTIASMFKGTDMEDKLTASISSTLGTTKLTIVDVYPTLEKLAQAADAAEYALQPSHGRAVVHHDRNSKRMRAQIKKLQSDVVKQTKIARTSIKQSSPAPSKVTRRTPSPSSSVRPASAHTSPSSKKLQLGADGKPFNVNPKKPKRNSFQRRKQQRQSLKVPPVMMPASMRQQHCNNCGRDGHLARDCHNNLTKCYVCGGSGHMLLDCPQYNARARRKVHPRHNRIATMYSTPTISALSLNNDSLHKPKLFITTNLASIPCTLNHILLDSGAQFSVVNKKIVDKYSLKIHKPNRNEATEIEGASTDMITHRHGYVVLRVTVHFPLNSSRCAITFTKKYEAMDINEDIILGTEVFDTLFPGSEQNQYAATKSDITDYPHDIYVDKRSGCKPRVVSLSSTSDVSNSPLATIEEIHIDDNDEISVNNDVVAVTTHDGTDFNVIRKSSLPSTGDGNRNGDFHDHDACSVFHQNHVCNDRVRATLQDSLNISSLATPHLAMSFSSVNPHRKVDVKRSSYKSSKTSNSGVVATTLHENHDITQFPISSFSSVVSSSMAGNKGDLRRPSPKTPILVSNDAVATTLHGNDNISVLSKPSFSSSFSAVERDSHSDYNRSSPKSSILMSNDVGATSLLGNEKISHFPSPRFSASTTTSTNHSNVSQNRSSGNDTKTELNDVSNLHTHVGKVSKPFPSPVHSSSFNGNVYDKNNESSQAANHVLNNVSNLHLHDKHVSGRYPISSFLSSPTPSSL